MSIEFSTSSIAPLVGAEVEGSFTLAQPFNQTVGVSIPPSGETTFSINSISASLTGDPEPIVVSTTTSSINISGRYLSGFDDRFTYVPPGESNKTASPITVIGAGNLPEGQRLYNLDQDLKQLILRSYSVSVTYTNSKTLSKSTENGTLTHAVFNDLEAIRSFMANYDYNQGAG